MSEVKKKRYSQIIQLQKINELTDWLIDARFVEYELMSKFNLFQIIKEGKLLCNLILSMMDKQLITIQNEQMVRKRLEKKNLNKFEKIDSVQIFLSSCRLIGFDDEELFTIDELENEDERVISTLLLFKELIELKEFPVLTQYRPKNPLEIMEMPMRNFSKDTQTVGSPSKFIINSNESDGSIGLVEAFPLMVYHLTASLIAIEFIEKIFE
jgi:hypothetical protein